MKVWCVCLLTLFLVSGVSADVKGLLDVRAVHGDDPTRWMNEGLGKQRFDASQQGLNLGQAVLDVNLELTDTVSSQCVLNAYDDRHNKIDATEIYLQWKPLPFDGYRVKTKIGAFFPKLSLENDGLGWTNPLMLSTSAINTWVGEELRTVGGEVTFSRLGAMNQSPHDIDVVAAVFAANDPQGGLLAWRGWSIGDRVTGLTETLPFPDVESYGNDGIFSQQAHWEKPFKEIDHRYGYYTSVNYGYNGWLVMRAMHYDNRGNPLAVHAGQYAWKTTFDHLALQIRFSESTLLRSQYMKGKTLMGVNTMGVYADFSSWYLMLSHGWGPHRVSVRYDNFLIDDEDHTEEDNNAETGHGLAVTYLFSVNDNHRIGVEWLKITSVHPGREYLGGLENEEAGMENLAESSVQLFYRYAF